MVSYLWRAVPWLLAAGLLLWQLVLGTSPMVLGLAAMALTLAILPYLLFGRDLFTILSALFGLRYVGAALILKSLYGQPLDSNLHRPLESFALTTVVLGLVALITISVRAIDVRSRFSIRLRGDDLSAVSAAAFTVGVAAQVVNGLTKGGYGGAASVISTALGSLFFLSLAIEVQRSLRVHGRVLAGRVWLLLGVAAALALFIDARTFFVTAVIVVFLTAFLHHKLKVGFVLVGMAVLSLGAAVLSPITLAVREGRGSATPVEAALIGAEAVGRAITDPAYFASLSERQRLKWRYSAGLIAFDYYGDRSNIANRLSYVALLDAVANGASTRDPIGWQALSEALVRVSPGFLVEKPVLRYEHGDWLSWHVGMQEPGRVYSANFGLPMEGLSTWGLIGLLAYPFLFFAPVLWLVSKVGSFREATPVSIMLFAAFQHAFVEGTTATFMTLATRSLPIITIASILIIGLCRRRVPAQARAARASH